MIPLDARVAPIQEKEADSMFRRFASLGRLILPATIVFCFAVGSAAAADDLEPPTPAWPTLQEEQEAHAPSAVELARALKDQGRWGLAESFLRVHLELDSSSSPLIYKAAPSTSALSWANTLHHQPCRAVDKEKEV